MSRFSAASGDFTCPPRHDRTAAAIAPRVFELSSMDRSVALGDDFFRYAVGTWVANAQIPRQRRGAQHGRAVPGLRRQTGGQALSQDRRTRANLVTKSSMSQSAQRLLAIVCVGICGQALADADGPDYFRVTGVSAGGALNIRSGPSANTRAITNVPADGQCVRNMGCQGGLTFDEFTKLSEPEKKRRLEQNPRWCKVEYRGKVGWAVGRYLAEGSCPGS